MNNINSTIYQVIQRDMNSPKQDLMYRTSFLDENTAWDFFSSFKSSGNYKLSLIKESIDDYKVLAVKEAKATVEYLIR